MSVRRGSDRTTRSWRRGPAPPWRCRSVCEAGFRHWLTNLLPKTTKSLISALFKGSANLATIPARECAAIGQPIL